MNHAREYGAVLVGGTLGSLLRDVLTGDTTHAAPAVWSSGTSLTVNLIACLAIGALYAKRARPVQAWLPFAAVGFCGGLSTFSLFAGLTHARLTETGTLAAVGAVAIEILLGLAAVALGARLMGGHWDSASADKEAGTPADKTGDPAERDR